MGSRAPHQIQAAAPVTTAANLLPAPGSREEAPLPLRRQPRLDSHDCADPALRRRLADELKALPFLGRLTCSTERLTAGEVTEVIVTYEVGASGIADSGSLRLCFKYYSDWDLQTERAGDENYASAEIVRRGAIGGARPQSGADSPRLQVRYDVKGGERPYQKALVVELEGGYLQPGDVVVLRLGDRRHGSPGTRVQTFVEDAFTFRLSLDTLGTSRLARGPEGRLSIRPGAPERLAVTGPRVVRVGTAAELHAHLQDRWGNACEDVGATFDALIGGQPVVPGHSPGVGWARATLHLPAIPGGHTEIEVRAATSDGRELSDVCLIDAIDDLPGARAFFADLHVHSHDTVGTQDTAWNIAYGRDIAGLDVLGYTGNDFQITDAAWDDVVAQCRAATEPDRFVCFPGVEWCGNAGVGGDHNVVFLGEDTSRHRSMVWHDRMGAQEPAPQNWPITELYAAYEHEPDAYLLIPHVGGRRAILDWHHPELDRLVEVHSAWGTSAWLYEDALRRGLRVGASAAGDEHRGRPGGGGPGANIFGTTGGLTGVLAAEHRPAEVARALRARRTWATTGARAVALLRFGDHWMGDTIDLDDEALTVGYALYGSAGWERMSVHDTHGELWARDLHDEVGLSETLVRIRWGGARHRNRYRWASWRGSLAVLGTELAECDPWAQTHPEQHFTLDDRGVSWQTATYGDETGLVLRVGDLAAMVLEIDARVMEDDLRQTIRVRGADLIADRSVHTELGGVDLRLIVERIAEPTLLPTVAAGELKAVAPLGDSAVYVRARQWDGHQVWTSPLFVTR
jgi:hypothetical protein